MIETGWIILAELAAIGVLIGFPWIFRGVMKALSGWWTDPLKMVATLIVAAIVGQGIGWIFGSDQIGFFMRIQFRVGAGVSFGQWLAGILPATTSTGWAVKLLEIAFDTLRIPVEAAVFFRHGFVPDVVATAVTQPLWTIIEVSEKIAGIAVNSRAIGTRPQIESSIISIYGSTFRLGQNLVLWFFGYQIYNFLTTLPKRILRWIVKIYHFLITQAKRLIHWVVRK